MTAASAGPAASPVVDGRDAELARLRATVEQQRVEFAQLAALYVHACSSKRRGSAAADSGEDPLVADRQAALAAALAALRAMSGPDGDPTTRAAWEQVGRVAVESAWALVDVDLDELRAALGQTVSALHVALHHVDGDHVDGVPVDGARRQELEGCRVALELGRRAHECHADTGSAAQRIANRFVLQAALELLTRCQHGTTGDCDGCEPVPPLVRDALAGEAGTPSVLAGLALPELVHAAAVLEAMVAGECWTSTAESVSAWRFGAGALVHLVIALGEAAILRGALEFVAAAAVAVPADAPAEAWRGQLAECGVEAVGALRAAPRVGGGLLVALRGHDQPVPGPPTLSRSVPEA
jgi:hypothetical protein